MSCGEKISRLRKSKGMTQEDLGRVLNVTYQAVSKWERGESLPDFETMSQIARYFQVPLSYFEEGSPEEPLPLSEREAGDTGNVCASVVGVCTVCGKMLKENEVSATSPKVICNDCAARERQAEEERRNREKEQRQRAAEEQKRDTEARIQNVLGRRADAKLIISFVIALAFYVLFTVLAFLNRSSDDEFLYAAIAFLLPLAAFGCTHALADFINDLRDKDDDKDGYTRNLSLISAAGFALVNVAIYLSLYLASESDGSFFYLIMLALGAVLSFTFVSQFLWGGSIKEIFTCGGFTFKMPGFIIGLDIDSLLWMILAKIFLSILAVIVFVVTTVFFAIVAILGSAVLFIPSVIAKSVKDKKARAELK